MVNFKISAFILASASCAMAAALPRANLAPRGMASPVFDEKSVVARDEIAGVEPVNELAARQAAIGGEAQLIFAIYAFTNASLPYVGAIQTVCANKNATTAQVASVTVASINAINTRLKFLLGAFQVFAAFKTQYTLTVELKTALTLWTSVLVKSGLALYSRSDLAAVMKLTAGPIATWLDLWVKAATALKTTIPTLADFPISTATGLGFTLSIANSLGWQTLQGYYC